MRTITTLQTSSGILIAALLLTACGDNGDDDTQAEDNGDEVTEEEAPEQDDPRSWFEEHCPMITADVDTAEHDSDARVMVQGPMRPPAGIAESSLDLRYFTYDEISEEMVPESDVGPDDLLCFELDLNDGDRFRTGDMIAGQEGEGSSAFTEVRTPEQEDGIWINEHLAFRGTQNMPGGLLVNEDDPTERCDGEWSPATDIYPADDGDHQEEPATWEALVGPEDC